MTVREIPIPLVDPNPYQVRSERGPALSESSVATLAQEIEAHGYWPVPLRARQVGDRYQLAWGQRRLAALEQLGRQVVLLDVVELDDEAMKADMALENCHRQPLAEDERLGLFKLLNVSSRKPSEVMQILGISLETFNRMAKLAAYEESTVAVKEAIEQGETTARTIAAADAFGGQPMVEQSIEQGWTSSDIDKLRREVNLLKDSHGPRVADSIKDEITSGRLTGVEAVRERANAIQQCQLQGGELDPGSQSTPPELVPLVLDVLRTLPEMSRKLELARTHAHRLSEADPELATRWDREIERLGRILLSLHEPVA